MRSPVARKPKPTPEAKPHAASLEVRRLPVSQINPAPYNPRTIKASAEAGLAASLEKFGDLSGIVWNQRSGHLVAGHQRVKQLRKLGAQLVDGALVVSVRGESRRFPIRVVDWDDVTEKAANIEANNPLIAGEYTAEIDAILAEIQASGFDASGLLLEDLKTCPTADIPEIDLGDGEIKEKPGMDKFTVFLPAAQRAFKRELNALISARGGVVVG
jgi:hypothetical protein